MREDGLYAALTRRGMSRRSFLKFTTVMAATLALPPTYAPRIAQAVTKAPRLPVIWVRGQSCAGPTEAFLRASKPSTASLLLDVLSLEYHESLMAPAGGAAELSRTSAMERYPDGYVAVVEGGIPTAAGGAYCLVGGRPFVDVVREVADGALATIAVGACAFDGGVAGANGGVTGTASLREVVSGAPTIALAGCPVNVVNLVATIVHYLTFQAWPAADSMGRPLFAYGPLIHNECERRPHFEFGEFVQSWGDEGAQQGWCLYKMGCKGPEAFGNCASVRFAEGTSWPVRAGHGCIGCTMPGFWDAMSPFYLRLPPPLPSPLPDLSVDVIGAALVGAVGAAAVGHGAGMYVVQRHRRSVARRAAAHAAGPPIVVEVPERAEVAAPLPPVPEVEAPATEAPAIVEPGAGPTEPGGAPPEPMPPEAMPAEAPPPVAEPGPPRVTADAAAAPVAPEAEPTEPTEPDAAAVEPDAAAVGPDAKPTEPGSEAATPPEPVVVTLGGGREER